MRGWGLCWIRGMFDVVLIFGVIRRWGRNWELESRVEEWRS